MQGSLCVRRSLNSISRKTTIYLFLFGAIFNRNYACLHARQSVEKIAESFESLEKKLDVHSVAYHVLPKTVNLFFNSFKGLCRNLFTTVINFAS